MNRKILSLQKHNSNISTSSISSNNTLLKSISVARPHKILYDSVQTLFDKYPPPKELETCWKETTFLKVNWEACNHLIRYLLMVYYGKEEIDKRMPTYLLHCRKNEGVFRKEAIDLINTMRSRHPDANICNVKTFDLLNPGGERFVALMIRISTVILKFVIDSEPTADDYQSLGFIQPTNNLEFNECCLKQASACTRQHLLSGLKVSDDYELKKQNYTLEANHIAAELEATLEKCESMEAEIAQLSQQNASDADELNKSELVDLGNLSGLSKLFEQVNVSTSIISNGDNLLSSDEPINLLQRCEELKIACQTQKLRMMRNKSVENVEGILSVNTDALKSLYLKQLDTLNTVRFTQKELGEVKSDLHIADSQFPCSINKVENVFTIDFS